MKLGISSYAYGWAVGFGDFCPPRPMDAMELLARAIRFKCRVVQIADNLVPEMLCLDERTKVVSRASNHGIELELGARRLTRERLANIVGVAREMKVKLVRFLIDGDGYHPGLGEVAAILRDAISELGEIRIAIENHDRFTAMELRQLMEQVSSDNVGICFDAANSFGTGECPETVIRQLAPWVINFHVKDVSVRRVDTLMGFLIEGCPAGEGKVDIRSLLGQLSNRCSSVILESWTPRQGTLAQTIETEADWVDRSYRYVKSLLDEGSNHA